MRVLYGGGMAGAGLLEVDGLRLKALRGEDVGGGLALRCLIRENQVGLAGVRVALFVRSPMQALCATGDE